MKKVSFPFSVSGLAILAILFWNGCASLRTPVSTKPAIYVSSKEPLFVGIPVVPDTVDSLLSHVGWGVNRFAQELQKEIVYQFNQKGIPTLPDSVGAKSILLVSLSTYVEAEGSPSSFTGNAILKTTQGEKPIRFGKAEKRAQALERSNPTVDNIRMIAEAIVTEARKQPVKPREEKRDPTPQLLMVF